MSRTVPRGASRTPMTLPVNRLASFGLRPAESAPIRRDLVARVRAKIADGSYDTPERLEAALDRMCLQIGA
jgi:Anti-sigma-28 factor, FlgM